MQRADAAFGEWERSLALQMCVDNPMPSTFPRSVDSGGRGGAGRTTDTGTRVGILPGTAVLRTKFLLTSTDSTILYSIEYVYRTRAMRGLTQQREPCEWPSAVVGQVYSSTFYVRRLRCCWPIMAAQPYGEFRVLWPMVDRSRGRHTGSK